MPVSGSNSPAAPPRFLPPSTCPISAPAVRALRPQTAALPRPQAYVPTPEPLLLYDLVAPKIDPHELTPIRCERPKRHGAYRLEGAWHDEKYVVHHYGHGGSGWTLGLGTTERALALFDGACRGAASAGNDEMTVVGGGFIGLYTAYHLAERFGGERVRVIADKFDDLTSHKAGGLLAPISLEVPESQQAMLVSDARNSLEAWQHIAQGRVRDFVGCAREMPVFLGDTTDAGLDVYYAPPHEPAEERLGFLPRPQRMLVQFDTGGLHNMWRQPNLFMDTPRMMARLQEALSERGVAFEQQRVNDIDALDGRFIFNCTGLGARTLAQDLEMYPVHGHLLGLGSQPAPEKLEYMIYATPPVSAQRPEGAADSEACYFMPKSVTPNGLGVIGGTFEARELDEREHLRLLADVEKRAVKFFNGT